MNMLTQSLRPNTLQEVKCQDTAVGIINNWFIKQSVPNIIFLNGDSGTGKSTTAYIISMLLQCKNVSIKDGIATPCLECSHCKDILTRSFQLDTHFIKGGEANKNDLMEISDSIKTQSILSDRTVFIIDESQSMGNNSTKGVLLNLLENDLDDVFIIIISMEDISNNLKMKKALNSRVQKVKFKTPSTNQIADYIFDLYEKYDPEAKIDIETFGEVILTIAENSEGSIRQAVQDFDTCMVQEVYTLDRLKEVMDYSSTKKVKELYEKLIKKDISFLADLEKENIIGFIKYGKKMLMDVLIRDKTNTIDEYQYRTNGLFYKNIKSVFDICNLIMNINEYSLDEEKAKFIFYNYLASTNDNNNNNIKPVEKEVTTKLKRVIKK